jgi:hypothetical protein
MIGQTVSRRHCHDGAALAGEGCQERVTWPRLRGKLAEVCKSVGWQARNHQGRDGQGWPWYWDDAPALLQGQPDYLAGERVAQFFIGQQQHILGFKGSQERARVGSVSHWGADVEPGE